MLTLISLLLACPPPPPSITTIEPGSGPEGTALVITGDNLVEGTTVKVGGKELADLVVTPPDRITGTVPAGLKAGPLDLAISTPQGKRIARNDAFELVPAVEADPCGTSERRMTHIPPTADVVKIDRWVTDDEVERSEIATRDIERIEYERRNREDGSCAAIYLKTGGSRVLFDAFLTPAPGSAAAEKATQAAPDLRAQAQKIANGLGKPVEVVADEAPPATP